MSDSESVSSVSNVSSVGSLPVTDSTVALFLQTLNLADHMQENARSLYAAYLALQGEPYTDPDFNFPDIDVTNLPSSAITYGAFLRQNDETRLRQNHLIYTIMSRFMQVVMEDQRDLNPAEESLTAKFEEALGNMDALLTNISTILDQMGIPPKTSLPDPLVISYSNNKAFKQRLRGFVVCREYKSWVLRTTRDMNILHKKYGRQN